VAREIALVGRYVNTPTAQATAGNLTREFSQVICIFSYYDHLARSITRRSRQILRQKARTVLMIYY